MTRNGAPVAILGPAPPDRGGIAQLTERLARELERAGPVSYFTYTRQYPTWLDPRRFAEFPADVPAPAVPLLDWRSPLSWRRAADTIAATRAEALIVPWWTAFWALPLRAVLRRVGRIRPDQRRVLICHNVEDHEGSALHRFFSLGVFLAADAYFVHSDWARRSLSRLAPGKPVGIAPLAAHEAPSIERREARRRLGIDRPLVLFVGLIRLYKGLDVLIRAAPEIVRATGARVGIVGESFRDAEEVERQWKSSPVRGDILRHDSYLWPEEIDEWLAACDVLVLPYRKIAGSAIAARALAVGCPIAASRVGALAETVVPGVTGELFESGDSAGLVRAVATVLSRGRAAYAPGLAAAAREASWPRYAEKLRDFLASIRTGSRS